MPETSATCALVGSKKPIVLYYWYLVFILTARFRTVYCVLRYNEYHFLASRNLIKHNKIYSYSAARQLPTFRPSLLNKIKAFPTSFPTRRSRLCIRLLALLSQHALGGDVGRAGCEYEVVHRKKKGTNLELHVILNRAWPQARDSVFCGRTPLKTLNSVLCTKTPMT